MPMNNRIIPTASPRAPTHKLNFLPAFEIRTVPIQAPTTFAMPTTKVMSLPLPESSSKMTVE